MSLQKDIKTFKTEIDGQISSQNKKVKDKKKNECGCGCIADKKSNLQSENKLLAIFDWKIN